MKNFVETRGSVSHDGTLPVELWRVHRERKRESVDTCILYVYMYVCIYTHTYIYTYLYTDICWCIYNILDFAAACYLETSKCKKNLFVIFASYDLIRILQDNPDRRVPQYCVSGFTSMHLNKNGPD